MKSYRNVYYYIVSIDDHIDFDICYSSRECIDSGREAIKIIYNDFYTHMSFEEFIKIINPSINIFCVSGNKIYCQDTDKIKDLLCKDILLKDGVNHLYDNLLRFANYDMKSFNYFGKVRKPYHNELSFYQHPNHDFDVYFTKSSCRKGKYTFNITKEYDFTINHEIYESNKIFIPYIEFNDNGKKQALGLRPYMTLKDAIEVILWTLKDWYSGETIISDEEFDKLVKTKFKDFIFKVYEISGNRIKFVSADEYNTYCNLNGKPESLDLVPYIVHYYDHKGNLLYTK